MSERGGGISLPGAPAQTPGLPENFSPLIFEEFAGLNTKPLRPGIQNGEMYWCDGWFPIGPSNARILPGTGPIINTNVGAGVTYLWIGFGNINDTNYCYAVVNDGRILQINPVTQTVTAVLPTGGIASPSSIIGFSQWGSQYIIFAKDQPNGYWLWDGVNLYEAGTVGPIVSVDDGGSGYASAPSVTVMTTGSGAGVAFSFALQNGAVTMVTVTDPGSGFGVTDFIALAIQGGGTDNQAYCTPPTPASGGGLSEVWVTSAGKSYTGYAYATVTGGGGSGATVSLAIQDGAITGAAVVTSGLGYTSTPTVTITDPGIPSGPPGGTDGGVACNLTFGQISGIVVANGGTGYTSPPEVKITGDGTGAAAMAQIGGGAVTSISMTNYGSGYTHAVVDLIGGNNAANISIELMPFGVSGTAVEVYEGHVWVSNGGAVSNSPPRNRVIFSDPDSPVGFGNGGGAFQSSDSFLRVGYVGLKQTNGFLYLIGDSSMNYVSGVQTSTPSGSTTTGPPPVPTTTFGNLNVDPQLGTPWPSSVQVFSRNIVFANTVGVYVSYGGAVKKVSDPLDGFYATSSAIFENGANFSAAVATIFGISVYMLLLTVIDPFANESVNKLLIWDGKKWFTSQQDKALIYIATQEINSILVAYGTDGNSIFPLFANPSIGFAKVMQSKLFAQPGYFTTKTSRSLTAVANIYTEDQPLTVTVDSEAGLGSASAEVTITPAAAGLVVSGPNPVGQQGRMIGLTVQTTASNVALLSMMLSDQVMSPNV